VAERYNGILAPVQILLPDDHMAGATSREHQRKAGVLNIQFDAALSPEGRFRV
jgi:hypothetical protein